MQGDELQCLQKARICRESRAQGLFDEVDRPTQEKKNKS